MPPEAGSRHHSNVRNNARGTRRRRQFQPRQRNPVAAAVTGNRPASPGDIADQRHGLNPGHDERHSPRRCIAALSPTAALQSVPGTSAARRRIKPRIQPAGSAAGHHPAATHGNQQDDHRESPRSARRSDAAEPQKRRRARPQRIKAGRDKGTTAERAYRLDFGLSRHVRRDYPRDGTRPEAGSRRRASPRAAEPGSRCSHREPPGKPWRHRRPAARTNPGHDERHSPRRCITVLPPTAALQSVPGTSAARRRIKPRTQPAGSTAGRHPGSNPRKPTRRSSGSRHDQPARSDAAAPQKRRRARPQRIKAGRDKGTTAERAYCLDFGLYRYARRGYRPIKKRAHPAP